MLRTVLGIALLVAVHADLSTKIQAAIEPIAANMARKYDCAVSVAVYKGGDTDGFHATSVGGVIDGKQTKTASNHKFVWGSVTKVLTGTGILRLVSKGILKLDDKIPPLVDPFIKEMKANNPSQNFSSVADLFGPETELITIEDLLGMKSGLPDYDTASPWGGEGPTDVLRKAAYANPGKDFGPAEMLNLPWVHTGKLLFAPGKCDTMKYFNCYSSTNFVLLGMILAGQAKVSNWDTFDQEAILNDVASDFTTPFEYALHGAPFKWTPVVGYDNTSYNHRTHRKDVSNVAGVFSGWTASDFVGDPTNIARFIHDVYAPPYKLVAKEYVDLMYNTSGITGYGLATFNLSYRTGQSGPDGVAMGHLGATYGYQSVVAYNPAMDFSLAIATNIETDGQSQPADTMCSIYNAVRAIIRGLPTPTCTFTQGYFSGGCKCTSYGGDVLDEPAYFV